MELQPWPRVLRGLVFIAGMPILACGPLLGLSSLERVDCSEDCSDSGDTPLGGGAESSLGGGASGTTSETGGSRAGEPPQAEGGGPAQGGSAAAGASMSGGVGGMANGGASGASGGGGAAGTVPECAGGPEPPARWQERWSGHAELLTLMHYDDCIALYFDSDVDPSAQPWLVDFLRRAWRYSRQSYGPIGKERVHVVVHQGRYLGGHAAVDIDPSHDGHPTIDMGADYWAEGDWDLPAHLLGILVDAQGARTKYGAPMGDDYSDEGFPLIYKYDLYQALGLHSYADAAKEEYFDYYNNRPYFGTFWFRDWFFPLWNAHGGAGLFARYMTLLEQHYPADENGWMPAMTYGEYIHFMGGAAGVDVTPVAESAFVWNAALEAEIADAKEAFPEIQY